MHREDQILLQMQTQIQVGDASLKRWYGSIITRNGFHFIKDRGGGVYSTISKSQSGVPFPRGYGGKIWVWDWYPTINIYCYTNCSLRQKDLSGIELKNNEPLYHKTL